MKLTLTTLPHWDGKITQRLLQESGEMERDYIHELDSWVTDTREKGIREALIQLGWTPPKGEA